MPSTLETPTEKSTSVALAFRVLRDHVRHLTGHSRDNIFELLAALRTAETEEDRDNIFRAMTEIIAHDPDTVRPMALPDDGPMADPLKKWVNYAAGKIKEFRKAAGLTQAQLAERSGIPQSHISRLENAEHSPTNLTLEKIAKALGIDVGEIDPGQPIGE